MSRGRRLAVAAVLVGAVGVLVLSTAGPPKPVPTPPGTFAFAVTGDSPYLPWEEVQYPLAVREMDETDLAFVLDVGDVFWRPCSDEQYRNVRARFERSLHPLFYTPGDNEWADCWEPASGGFRPLERLATIRTIFFGEPRRSFGVEKIDAQTQADDPRFPELRENVRWEHGGVVFVTVDLVGSRNATHPYPGRTAAEDADVVRRTAGATAWMRAAFAHAAELDAKALVIAFHADFESEAGPPGSYPRVWEPFLSALDEEAARFGRPVLVAHGDGHHYWVRHPMRAQNVTTLQVPGSPLVGWVRVVVDTRARDPFSFDEHVVPRWKYW